MTRSLTVTFRWACGRILAGFLLAAAIPSSAWAGRPAQILDQFLDLASGERNISTSVGVNGDKAQTFTVGIPGTLTAIEILTNVITPDGYEPTAPLVVEIRPTSDGVPLEADDSALATVTLPPSATWTGFEFVRVDLREFNLQVSAGEVLAIVLQSNTGAGVPNFGYYGLLGSNRIPYTGGEYFERFPNAPGRDTWGDYGGVAADLLFKTYVYTGNPTSSLNLAKVKIRLPGEMGVGTRYRISGEMLLDDGSNGIDVSGEQVTVLVGGSSLRVPAGAFLPRGDGYRFKGTLGGQEVRVDLTPELNRVGFAVDAHTDDLRIRSFDESINDPWPILVIIGDDLAGSSVSLKGQLRSGEE